MQDTKRHFLEQYKVQDKPEAKKAAERKELRTGQKDIVTDRSKRIESYIERLENIFLNSDKGIRERNIELIKPEIYKNTLVKYENFPESYFEFQKKTLKNRGLGEIEFNEEQKKLEIERIQEIQRKSLDVWIEYLTGDDCKYPADLKYFVIQGVLRLGNFEDKQEKYSFTKRNKSTTAPFIELDREALSVVLGALDSVHNNKPTEGYSENLLDLIQQGNDFGDMYALAMYELDQKVSKKELLPQIFGEWKVFEQGSDPQTLVDSLVGKRSNLCLRDIGSAQTYLSQGVVEIYFSKDKTGEATIPRIAIAYADEKGGVYEVRGTYNKNEDLDPYIERSDVLTDKLNQLPNGETFLKRDANMKKVTELYDRFFDENKNIKKELLFDIELTDNELRFLYEIDSPIRGFGYEKDPRVGKILSARNRKKDLAQIFHCSENQISTTREEALSQGRHIVYHDGNISFFSLESATDTMFFPRRLGGDLDLRSLTSTDEIRFPEFIQKNLILRSLPYTNGFVLPEFIGGSLDLQSLTSAKNLHFPKVIGGILHLESLGSLENTVFPESVGGLYLNSLTSGEKIILPKNVGHDLNLESLMSADGLVFPESVKRCIDLESLSSIEGLILPKFVGKAVLISHLSAQDLENLKKLYPHIKFIFTDPSIKSALRNIKE